MVKGLQLSEEELVLCRKAFSHFDKDGKPKVVSKSSDSHSTARQDVAVPCSLARQEPMHMRTLRHASALCANLHCHPSFPSKHHNCWQKPKPRQWHNRC